MQESLASNSDYKRSLLNSLDLFKGVYPDDIQGLLQRCDRRDLEKGENLLSPRQKNEHVFVVLSGSLNIHVGSPEAPILVTMEAGECVGEMSIIEDRDPYFGTWSMHHTNSQKTCLWCYRNVSAATTV